MGLAKMELRQLLDDNQREEWQRAIKSLEVAFAWCAEAATPDKVTTGIPKESKRAQVLQCLLAIYSALNKGKEYLELLPNFFQIGQPGPTLRDGLMQNQKKLQNGAQELSQMHAELEQLLQQEEAIRKQAKEQEALRKTLGDRKKELERLSQLAEPQAVEALRQQVKELEEHLPPEGIEAEQLEYEIRQEAEKLITLNEKYLKALHPQVRSLLERSKAKEGKLQELLNQLQFARERYNQARQEVEKRAKELEPYIEADRLIAEALPNAQGILSLVEKAESLVKTAEEALKRAIEDNERQAQRQAISITGEILQR